MSDLWIVAISFSDINLDTHAVFWLNGKLASGVFLLPWRFILCSAGVS